MLSLRIKQKIKYLNKMTQEEFIKKLKSEPTNISFQDTMAVIESNYLFKETPFTNGKITNEAGKNSGSCKLFSFAKLNKLSKEETLACFGNYYKVDVLQNPNGDDHQNIRNFMQSGWDGISFEKEALTIR